MGRWNTAPLAVALLAAGTVRAQTPTDAAVEGRITDRATGTALPGATVRLEPGGRGAAADAVGRYRVASLPPGRYTLTVRLVGYAPLTAPVELLAGRAVRLDLSLVGQPLEVAPVEVTADRKARAPSDTRSSVQMLRPQEAKALPGAAEDVMRALQTLPGVVSINDFTSRLVVRGSGPDQNLNVIDDVEIFNPYNLYSVLSVYNPDLIADIQLLTGGMPARYGDRLSAALDVTYREGDESVAIRPSLNASVTSANAIVEGRLPLKIPGSYWLSGRRTYYDLIAGPVVRSLGVLDDGFSFPNFNDLQGKLVFRPVVGQKLIVGGLRSRNGLNIVSAADSRRPDSVSARDQTRNDFLSLAWHQAPNERIANRVIGSWYRTAGDSQFGAELLDPAVDRASLVDPATGELRDGVNPDSLMKLRLDSRSGFNFRKWSLADRLSVQFGDRQLVEIGAGVDLLRIGLAGKLVLSPESEAFLRDIEKQFGRLPREIDQAKDYYRYHVFGQNRLRIGRFFVQPGLRLDHYRLINRTTVSPRLNLSVAATPLTTVRAAWGVFYQSPGYEKLFDQTAFFDLFSSASAIQSLRAERSVHTILGIERVLTDELRLRVEAYHKGFSNLIVQRKGVPDRSLSGGFNPPLVEPIEGVGLDYNRRQNWRVVPDVERVQLGLQPVNDASGRADGFEVLLDKASTHATTRLSGWLSYSFSRSERHRAAVTVVGERGTYHEPATTVPFVFDQRHTLNLVGSLRLGRGWELGARASYGSGLPITEPVGITPRTLTFTDSLGRPRAEILTDRNGRVVFNLDYGPEQNLFATRKPATYRLDTRLTRTVRGWGGEWAYYLDVINLTNHRNVVTYDYFVRQDFARGTVSLERKPTYALPILPTLGVSVRF